MKISNFQFPISKQGFTLLETLVSLFILSIAITGAFSVISFNVGNANLIKNNFIASGLAQEGAEVVRNLRDTDWFAERTFGAFGNPDGTALPNGIYQVQWNSNTLIANPSNPPLNKTTEGFYTYDDGFPTIFQRAIEIKSVVPSSGPVIEIIATVRITWQERGGQKEIEAEQHLFNWY